MKILIKSSSKFNPSFSELLRENITDLYLKTHALSDYAIKNNKKKLPLLAMFGGLAERLLNENRHQNDLLTILRGMYLHFVSRKRMWSTI
jgi:hypothetical protein